MLSSVDLAVHLSSYRNPSSATATGSACGSACNNTFNFCLQGTPGSCEYGTVNSSTVQSDNFSFDSVLSELNISNPLQFDNFTPAAAVCDLDLTITRYHIDHPWGYKPLMYLDLTYYHVLFMYAI